MAFYRTEQGIKRFKVLFPLGLIAQINKCVGAVPSGDSSFWGPLLLGTTPFWDRFIYLMIQIENSFPFACTNGRPTYRPTFLTHVFFSFVYTNGRPT